MFSWVVVVEDDFNDFFMFEDEGVDVLAVDSWVCHQVLGSSECCVESRNLLMNVSDVVKPGTNYKC